MKKFTLLIAMLVCAVSFGQNFSDLPVEEVNKAKQAKIDQAARTAKAVSSAFASAATMGENNPTYINQLTQEQKAAFNEEVSKLSVLSPGNNPVFANRLSQEQLASFDEEVSNLKANSSESNPTYANQLTAEQAANFNQSPSNLGVIANVSSNPIFTGNQKVISPNTTDSSFVPCNGENASNAFENGRGCSVNNNWTAANDLIVTAGNDAMLTSIVPNIFMSVGASATAVDVTIYEDAAGLPGTMVAQELGLVPSSSVVVGSNFGLDISAVTLDLTPVALAGDAAMDTNYWVAIQVTTSDGANAFWEDSTATAVGADLAFNDGTGWIIPGPGQDGVYTFVVDCTPMGGGVACDESNPSNAFENGRGCSVNNNWTAANDFTLLAGSDGMLTSIVPNIFMSVGATATTVDVTIYDDAGGLPGTMIDQQLAVVPTSQVVVGSNFGLDISAVTMDLTPVALAGDAAMDTQYWVAIQVTTSDGANAFWEDSTASAIGADLAFNDGTGWIIPGPGQDGVYTYIVECSDIGGGGSVACNEENPSNAFENGRGCSVNNNWTAANDITVATGFDAMLSSIVPNIFMSVGATATTVDVTIFEDAGGLPGTMIDQQLAVVPTSQVVVGSNFGLDISAVTLDLTPVALAGDAAMDVPYWVAIQVTTSDGANAFWEDTTATSIGADLAFNDGTGWIIPGPGQDGVYTYVADCTDIGSAPVACDESNPSNAFENGRGCSANNNWTAANDITVATGFDAMLSSIVPNIFMSVGATATTVDVTIFDDAAGLPGTMIDQQLGLVPTSQVVVGSNFGLDISEVTIDLTPVALAGDAGADTPYWVAIQVVTSDGANAFWEDSTASANGADLAFNDGTGWIIPGPGQDGVYTFVAECTEIGGGGGDFCTAGTYDDRAAFDAELALGTAFLEDFGGGPAAIQGCDGPISAAGNSCFPAGEILDGIVITSSTPDETDPMVFAPAGFSVNVDDVVGTNQFTSYTIINFPDNDMNAFGFDLHSLVSGSPVDLRIFGASGLIETVTVDVTSQGPVFFGYIAEEIITSVEMEDLSGANVELIAQFAFGNCSTGPVLTEDECGGAIPVACDDVVVGDTSDNTDTGGNSAAPDEWYSFTGTGSPQVVTVSLCDGGTGYDSRLTVYDACDGNEVATNDDSCGLQSELSFFSDGTSTYYIAVEGFGAGDVGAFSMAITCVDPPVNDMCDGALAIACGDTLAGTTLNATDDTGAAPDCDTTTSAPGVWYVYEDTSGFPSDILVSTCSANTDYDTKISVYTGDCGAPPLTCVAGNDDSANCTDFQSEVEFQSDGNTTFYILVHGFNGDQGDFDITMTCTIVPPPNDEIANAIDLDEVGCPFTDTDVVMPGATTEDGNPTDCNIDGANGVWYKLTPTGDGFIRGTVGTPAGVTSVTFYTAPNESSTEDELVLVDWFENQCFPNVTARIPAVAGQSYYCFVVNSGGVTDIIFDECETLGVEELEAYGFSFYPNPADEVINLSSAELIESVEVYSILGQRVLVQDINATTSQINISALSQGAYLMQVSINGQVGTYKILKK